MRWSGVSVAAHSRAMLPVFGGICGWMSATWSAISRRACASRAEDRRGGSRSGTARRGRRVRRAPRRRDRCARLQVSPIRAGDLLVGGARPEQLAEVEPALAVETEQQGPVRGQARAVAGAAERRRGRGDDAERGAVRQPEPLGRRPVVLAERGHRPVAAAIDLEDLALRDHLAHVPAAWRRPRPCTR